LEGSLTSVYFWRQGQWTTPPVDVGLGGQRGTTRRWALEKGLAVEGVVTYQSLVDGEECWISNGVRGFVFGTVQVPEPVDPVTITTVKDYRDCGNCPGCCQVS
jgi:4-amino-4-deoxychorismate lyase